MECLRKHIECEWAGCIMTHGCKELGEKEGFYKYPVCYNDTIQRDYTRCNK
jgi:hypothetical protein